MGEERLKERACLLEKIRYTEHFNNNQPIKGIVQVVFERFPWF